MDGSGTRNASESPFLRLPPEIRVRIYDHLFASTAIHVFEIDEDDYMEIGRSYRMSLCENPEQHMEVPSRYVEHMKKSFDFIPSSCTVGQHGDIEMSYGEIPVTPRNIGLELLLVSRQVYFEARLKPFTEISFHYNARYLGTIDAFSRLLDQMSPQQVKVLARVRIIIEHHHDSSMGGMHSIGFPWRSFPDKKTILKLKGLKDLELVLSPSFWDDCDAESYLVEMTSELRPHPALQALKILCLRSLRITLEPQFDQRYLDGLYATFASKDETARLVKWLKHLELELHFGRKVALGRVRMPRYGIKQDDPTSRAIPWTSPDQLEQTRLVRTEEAKKSQVEAELCKRIMMEKMCRSQKCSFTMVELEEVQEEAVLRRREDARRRREREDEYW